MVSDNSIQSADPCPTWRPTSKRQAKLCTLMISVHMQVIYSMPIKIGDVLVDRFSFQCIFIYHITILSVARLTRVLLRLERTMNLLCH